MPKKNSQWGLIQRRCTRCILCDRPATIVGAFYPRAGSVETSLLASPVWYYGLCDAHPLDDPSTQDRAEKALLTQANAASGSN